MMQDVILKNDNRFALTINDEVKIGIVKTEEGYIIDVWTADEQELVKTMTVWNDELREEV